MKIISEISDEKVLVSLTKDELSNLLGNYSKYDINREFLQQVIKDETNIEIHDIYRKHSLINKIQTASEWDKARTKLQEMLEALTPIENKIEALSKL